MTIRGSSSHNLISRCAKVVDSEDTVLTFLIDWIIGDCNSRVFIGLAIMVYELLCRTLRNMVSVRVMFVALFIFVFIFCGRF